jgi:hypothetical protein
MKYNMMYSMMDKMDQLYFMPRNVSVLIFPFKKKACSRLAHGHGPEINSGHDQVRS